MDEKRKNKILGKRVKNKAKSLQSRERYLDSLYSNEAGDDQERIIHFGSVDD